MSGEVGPAWLGQRVGTGMLGERLQGVADGGLCIAIVDEKRSAAVFGYPRRNRLHQRVARRCQFDYGAVRSIGGVERQQRWIRRACCSHENEITGFVQSDRTLLPLPA